MFEIPTRKQQWRHLLSRLESPRSNREKERTEWSVQQLPQTGMASQVHPPTNGKAESQQGPREPLLPPCPPPPLRSILSVQPASQPTAAAHRSALHRPTCLQLHVESDFPLFFSVLSSGGGGQLSSRCRRLLDGCPPPRGMDATGPELQNNSLTRPFLYQPAIPMLKEGGSQNKSPPPGGGVLARRVRSVFSTVPREEIDRGKQGKHECLAYIHAA